MTISDCCIILNFVVTDTYIVINEVFGNIVTVMISNLVMMYTNCEASSWKLRDSILLHNVVKASRVSDVVDDAVFPSVDAI